MGFALACAAATKAQYWKVDPTYAPTFTSSGGTPYITWTARQADGRYLYGGLFDGVNGTPLSNTGGSNLVRLNNDGSLDAAFPVQLHSGDVIDEVISQADGKIIIRGSYHGSSGIVRINTDGSVDGSFGPVATSVEVLAVDGAGLIYGSDNYGPLTRYLSGGAVDPTFSSSIVPSIVIPLASGKVVVVDRNSGGASRLSASGAVEQAYMLGLYVAHEICALPDGGICVLTNGDYAGPVDALRHYTASNVNDLTINVSSPTQEEFAGMVYDQLAAQGAAFAGYTNGYTHIDVSSSGQAMFVGQGQVPQRLLKASPSGPSYFVAPGFYFGPQDITVSVGDTLGSALFAFPLGLEPFTFQWYKGGVAVPGQTSNALSITNAQQSDAGTYTLLLSTPDGSLMSYPAVLSVQGLPGIIAQPAGEAVLVGHAASLSVTAAGTPDPTYQWQKGGSPVAGATAPTYSIGAAQLSDAGSYTVTVTNSYGSVTSNPAVLTVTDPNAGPQITSQPSPQTAVLGSGASFSVTATGEGSLSYQWYFGGQAIAGATGPTLTLAGVSRASAGSYSVSVSTASASVTSAQATLTVLASQLTNLSARAFVGSGSNILIAGYSAAGTGNKATLVRAVGPGLSQFNVSGVLVAPVLSVYDSAGVLVASDSTWGSAPAKGTSPVQALVSAATSSLFTSLGAFGLASGSADSAMVVTLPAGLPFTAQVAGSAGSAGTALVELYDADAPPAASRLVNLSSRAFVGAGTNDLIAGFGVSGPAPERVLIRAVGPGLSQFNVAGALAKPQLTLYDSGGKVIAVNTAWGAASPGGTSAVSATIAAATADTFGSIGAFGLASGSADCAMVATLPPGSTYTAEVTGIGGATGVALVEVYELP